MVGGDNYNNAEDRETSRVGLTSIILYIFNYILLLIFLRIWKCNWNAYLSVTKRIIINLYIIPD